METITVKYNRDRYDNKCYLYNKTSATFTKGLTVLVGCNGAGKSTMLCLIKDSLKRKNINTISFDNLRDGGSNAMSALGFFGRTNELILDIKSSEGEKTYNNIGRFIGNIKQAENEILDSESKYDKTTMAIILDSIDSGTSIDNIVEIKDFLKLIIQDQKERNNIDVFIITVANEFEMANGEQCYDVVKGKYIIFKNYNHYRKFILDSRKTKDKRNEKWNIQLEKNDEIEQKEKEADKERRMRNEEKRNKISKSKAGMKKTINNIDFKCIDEYEESFSNEDSYTIDHIFTDWNVR